MSLRLILVVVSMVNLLFVGAARAQESSLRADDPRRFVSSAASASSVKLAEGGKALLPIVISTKASDELKTHAGELQKFLQRITGAKFAIESRDDASAGIIVGTIEQFPDSELAPALAIVNGFDGREAYAIRTQPGNVKLIGATDLATSHAIYRMLEQIGCRWFFPGQNWEIIPSVPSLSFGWNETDRPVILSRNIWYAWGFFKDEGKPMAQSRARMDYLAWGRRNRMTGSIGIRCGHAWQSIIKDNQATFEAHPEYLAMVKGKRLTKIDPASKFCVSNPEVQKIVVNHVLEMLRKNPTWDMVSVEPSDGPGGHCECENCLKLGSVSDRVFTMANVAARAVAKEFPGKLVGLYAYNMHSQPPKFALEPNVYVQLTAGFTYGELSFTELLDVWPTKCKYMGYYDYFSTWIWDQDRLPGGRANNLSYIKERIPLYAQKRGTSIDAESGNNWGLHGRNYYVANRLMWNPQVNVDALLEDFYAQCFGAGAPAMKRYYERLDSSSKNLLSTDLVAAAFRDVEEASNLTKSDAAIQARLADVKHFLRWIHLTWIYDREAPKEKQTDLALQALSLVYRSRYSYMNHYEGMRQRWTRKVSDDAKQPTWYPLDMKSKKPWEVDEPITAEETETWFREGMKYFKMTPVKEKEFSNDLIPVQFPDAPKAKDAPNSQGYQGGSRYVFYSLNGEPLEMEISVGRLLQYRNKPLARYTLLGAKGQKVAEERVIQLETADDDGDTEASSRNAQIPGAGWKITVPLGKVLENRMPLDNEPKQLKLAVPGPGMYVLDYSDSGSGWTITVPAGRPCSILLPRDRQLSQQVPISPYYIYVPKGTRSIDFYWNSPSNTQVPKLVNPEGKSVVEFSVRGSNYSVPVPAGMDGKIWTINNMVIRHLWFYNVPNVIATSPEALLVPREVAEADKLVKRGK